MLALTALTQACSTHPPAVVDAPASELAWVPFFPQNRYQCGPAALATVLVASGVSTTPEALVGEVYLPDRRGSLQLEVMASARRHGRLPVPLPGDLTALLEEVAAGSPVLVLQNLGFSWWPRWHYAVVVGYDPTARRVLLRSGRQVRRQEPIDRFERSWALADRWALRVVKPGEVPARGEAHAYLRAVMSSRQSFTKQDLGRALVAGAARWPGAADLAFAAANQLREDGDTEQANTLFVQALAADPDHAGALNNLADLLLSQGDVTRARELIDRALRVVPGDSPLRPVVEATSREVDAAH